MAAGARITQSYTREVATRNNNIIAGGEESAMQTFKQIEKKQPSMLSREELWLKASKIARRMSDELLNPEDNLQADPEPLPVTLLNFHASTDSPDPRGAGDDSANAAASTQTLQQTVDLLEGNSAED
eukprot:Selendium_serpulae@DN5928_c0_g1_i1.p1